MWKKWDGCSAKTKHRNVSQRVTMSYFFRPEMLTKLGLISSTSQAIRSRTVVTHPVLETSMFVLFRTPSFPASMEPNWYRETTDKFIWVFVRYLNCKLTAGIFLIVGFATLFSLQKKLCMYMDYLEGGSCSTWWFTLNRWTNPLYWNRPSPATVYPIDQTGIFVTKQSEPPCSLFDGHSVGFWKYIYIWMNTILDVLHGGNKWIWLWPAWPRGH
jgi:hypothetical protein